MNHCRDCKYWEKSTGEYDGTQWEGIGWCKLIDTPTGYKEERSILACVADLSDMGSLLCMPDFGCVEFHGKNHAN
jgi:hypothetical protein